MLTFQIQVSFKFKGSVARYRHSANRIQSRYISTPILRYSSDRALQLGGLATAIQLALIEIDPLSIHSFNAFLKGVPLRTRLRGNLLNSSGLPLTDVYSKGRNGVMILNTWWFKVTC